MMLNKIIPALLFLVASATLQATSIFDLIYQDGKQTPVTMTLTVPVDSLLAKSPHEQDAKLRFVDNDGRTHRWDLGVSIRGKFRRSRCSFAPLKLNFKKGDLKAVGLAKHDKYKLVTPCTDEPAGDDLIMKEYLAYRAYAMLARYHFRVQLLEITYVDANGVHPDRTETAFLIEDTDEMAARYEAVELEQALGQPAAAYDAKAEATHALLQYLIGNGDWSLPLVRNLKVIQLPDGKLAPVGYDFDFSGWVGAPYASPSSEIGQQSIYERVYLGYAQDDRLLREVATEFRDHRRELIGLVTGAGLNDADQEVLWRWVARFFSQLNRMNKQEQVPLYDQLRGEIASVIPPGADASSYGVMGR